MGIEGNLKGLSLVELYEYQRIVLDISQRYHQLIQGFQSLDGKVEETDELKEQFNRLIDEYRYFEDTSLELDEIIGNKTFNKLGLKYTYKQISVSLHEKREYLLSLIDKVNNSGSPETTDGPVIRKLELDE